MPDNVKDNPVEKRKPCSPTVSGCIRVPKGRRDFKMATLDVTEKVNVLVDAIGWESFCEELMERMDEDALDAVCDRIAPRYGVELAGSRYAA